MLRGLLGFWAEDEQGHDCGQEVRMRASTLLGLLETHEQTLIAQRCAQQVNATSVLSAQLSRHLLCPV